MLSRTLVLLAAAVLATMGGCGGDDDNEAAQGGTLTFTRDDGSTFSVTETRAACAASQTDSAREAIIVGPTEPPTEEPTEPFFVLEGILDDVSPSATIELPNDFISDDPSGARLYAYDPETANELSSSVADASGEIVFENVSCEGGAQVDLTIDATLGSELSDLGTVEVEGSFTASADDGS